MVLPDMGSVLSKCFAMLELVQYLMGHIDVGVEIMWYSISRADY